MAKALNSPDSDFSDDDFTPLDISFNKAAEHLKTLTSKLNTNQLLELYGLYKQGTEGKCNIPKPSWLDGKGRKKWEAWTSLREMSSEEAKQKYVELLKNYDPDWSDNQHHTCPETKQTWVAVSSMMHNPEPDLIMNELSILEAAREDCADRVTQLLTVNPELKYEKDDDGLTALHWAADRDATSSLVAAIKGGCPIDSVDNYGQTALHYAASCGHLKSTQILLDAGASIIKDIEDNTPLDLASDNEVRKILEGVISS